MTWPLLPAFTAGPAASADMNTLVDGMNWLVGDPAGGSGSKAHGWATISTPQEISSPSTYTLLTWDTPGDDADGSIVGEQWVAQSNAFLVFAGLSRVSASLGNKEIRLIVDGVEEDYFGADNRFGIATEAFCSLSVPGLVYVTTGQTVDVGVFCDAPTPPSVIVGRIAWCTLATVAPLI